MIKNMTFITKHIFDKILFDQEILCEVNSKFKKIQFISHIAGKRKINSDIFQTHINIFSTAC